jgi:hypothetical protein
MPDNGLGKVGVTAFNLNTSDVNQNPNGAAPVGGIKVVVGTHNTVAASDTVVTGLATVITVVAVLDADPGDDPGWVSASIGDQAGAPAAGSVLIKTWKTTNAANDVTPIAATTFAKKVNWIAIGT